MERDEMKVVDGNGDRGVDKVSWDGGERLVWKCGANDVCREITATVASQQPSEPTIPIATIRSLGLDFFC